VSAAGGRPLRDGAGLLPSGADVVTVTGADAWSFLQGLVSAEVAALEPGQGVHSLLLTPQGKLDVDFRALRVGADAWLLAEEGFGRRLAESLQRFRIRVDADVEERATEFAVLALRGPASTSVARDAGGPELPAAAHAHAPWPERGARVVRVDALGWEGVDLVTPTTEVDEIRAALVGAGAVPVDAGTAEAARIGAGIPRQGLDLDEKTIPQEALLERDAVSFTKGCFLGQELVARIDSRGHVNRLLRRLRLDGERPPRGATLQADGGDVGVLTSVAEGPGGVVALGYVRREVEPGASVTVSWDEGTAAATVHELPEARQTLS